MSITINRTGEVKLTIPAGVSEREALRFFEGKKEWVDKARARVRERYAVPIISMPYSTLSYRLYLDPCATKVIAAKVRGGEIRVSYPSELSYQSSQVQEIVRKGIEEAWRIEAAEILPRRVKELGKAFGFRSGKVSIRNTRTRWGSCSGSDDISLSLHLMKLPPELIDYIIIHELCHTVHKNHGPRFHALLDKCTGGKHLSLRRQLKSFRI